MSSLAQNYTKKLDLRTHRTQVWLSVKDYDVSSVCWKALVNTFTETLVLKAFSATGIGPQNAEVVLDRFKTAIPPQVTTPLDQTAITPATREPNWFKAKSLLRVVAKDNVGAQLSELQQVIHQLHVRVEPLQYELGGAKEALCDKEKTKDKQKVLLYTRTILSVMAAPNGGVIHQRRRQMHVTLHLKPINSNKKLKELPDVSYNTK